MKTEHDLLDYKLKGQEKFSCDYCEYSSYKQKSIQIHKFIGKELTKKIYILIDMWEY